MNIEEEIFNKYKVDFNKLIKFGFIKQNENYIYSKIFLDSFKSIIVVDRNGKVSGKVIDLDTNLEYINIRLNNTLSFVNKVREYYKLILMDIRNNCFIENYFIYKQSNLICEYIYKMYNDKPEFLWNNSLSGVFRNKINKKWYAIIMNISGNSFNKSKNIEIINVKIKDNLLDELLKINGIYLAYHMNKKKWISILLDETIDINLIKKLIDDSYKIVSERK